VQELNKYRKTLARELGTSAEGGAASGLAA